MKKQLLLIASLFIVGSVKAQIYLSEDWTGGTLTSNNAWTTYSTDATLDWEADDYGQSGNFYAAMTNYNSGNSAVTSWLISPSQSLASATAPYLSFKNAYNFPGDPLELMISTDYTGSGDPSSNGTWTDLTSLATWSTGSFNWANTVDL
ncbi:MAG: DUF5017 domain-containing protein, partial [Crocinitomicaceae bacterium]|nr:DUF5017 domain-containing protein [Crocinitomicaceae bacterium]